MAINGVMNLNKTIKKGANMILNDTERMQILIELCHSVPRNPNIQPAFIGNRILEIYTEIINNENVL